MVLQSSSSSLAFRVFCFLAFVSPIIFIISCIFLPSSLPSSHHSSLSHPHHYFITYFIFNMFAEESTPTFVSRRSVGVLVDHATALTEHVTHRIYVSWYTYVVP